MEVDVARDQHLSTFDDQHVGPQRCLGLVDVRWTGHVADDRTGLALADVEDPLTEGRRRGDDHVAVADQALGIG